jgi:hypothetical protein
VIPVTALCVVVLYLSYLVQRTWMPRLSAVSLVTTKSETAHPLFLILVGIGIFMLLLFLVEMGSKSFWANGPAKLFRSLNGR